MSVAGPIGPAQIAALLVLAQRAIEEIHAQRNTRRLVARGAREVGESYYPVVAVTHIGWIAAIFTLIPPSAPLDPRLAALFGLLQVLRYWVIASLGPYWTHRILTIDGVATVRSGPYRLIRHPNYAITRAETFLLPWVFGSVALGAIFGVIWWFVLAYKISIEDAALAERRRG